LEETQLADQNEEKRYSNTDHADNPTRRERALCLRPHQDHASEPTQLLAPLIFQKSQTEAALHIFFRDD